MYDDVPWDFDRRKLIAIVAGAFVAGGAGSVAPVRVRIRTSMGPITVALAADTAPLTAANFLAHVDRHLYNGAAFYRVVKPEGDRNPVPINVIQGGLSPRLSPLPPIAHESTKMTGLRHRAGTISMARYAPGSATCEFFICVTDNPSLDFGGARLRDGFGFAAFGQVIEGMDVVRAIHALDGAPGGTGITAGQMLAKPVPIVDMRRLRTVMYDGPDLQG